MPTSFSLHALPQLDDRDVRFLYEIVSSAQQSNQRPIKALFTAYENVLQQHGADADHDSKYFRFLSHVGGELARDGTNGLVKRFRHVLSQAGIHLVLEGADAGSEGSHGSTGYHDYPSPVRNDPQLRRRRRASFNDSNLDATWASKASRSRVLEDMDDQPPRASSAGDGHVYGTAKSLMHRRSASVVRHEGSAHAHVGISPLVAWATYPDKQRSIQEASRFLFDTLGRRCLWIWHSRALRTKRRQQDLSQIASNHDKRTLLKQSFLQMKSGNFENRFWQQQERRAGRARDLFLLTKAFTHWAQAASDEVFRTSLARRHILRTRYFNAWRDITAINELKCRRVALLKWFKKWKSRSMASTHGALQAATFRHNASLKTAYWRWFWSFCERKAPIWKDVRSKVSSMYAWRSQLNHLQDMGLAAQGRHNSRLQKKAMNTLHGRLLSRQDDLVVAYEFLRSHSLHKIMVTLRRKIKLQPREVQFNADYDARILQRAFACWSTNVRLSIQASSINLRRLQGHALTSWNDQLRLQILRVRIDDRLVIEALYRWVLRQRLALFLRVMDHRRTSYAFHLHRSRTDARRFQLFEATQLLQSNQDMRLLRSNIAKLYQRVRVAEQQTCSAIEMYSSAVLPKTFDVWKARSTETRKLNRWATQARFYCLTHSSIKRWHDATIESQRRRRREAYATVRRRQKMSIARRCLSQLKQRSAHVQALELEAERKSRIITQAVVRARLHRWRTLAVQWQADMVTADRIGTGSRLHEAFSALLARYEDIGELDAQARRFAVDGHERLARKVIRKLVNVDFGLRRNIETAEAWHDRKSLQRRQAIIRRWLRKASDVRETRAMQDVDSPTRTPGVRSIVAKRATPFRYQMDESMAGPSVSMLGNVAILDQSRVDDSGISTPGYLLRTPSRRRNRTRFGTAASRPTGPQQADLSLPLDFGSSVLASTTPAPFTAGPLIGMESLTPQITPFQRKMLASGFTKATATPLSATRSTRNDGAGGLLLRELTETPYNEADASAVRRTGRAVRFGRTRLNDISHEDAHEDVDMDRDGDDVNVDESPSRPRS